MPVIRWVLLGVVGLLTGCPGGTEDPGVLLGSGEVEFETVGDGDTMQVIRGPQGGYHLLGSVLVKGMIPGDREDLSSTRNPTITFDVVHGDESIVLIDSITQGLDEAPSSQEPYTHQLVGRFVLLDITSDAELDGETVTMSVVVDDVGGESQRDEVTVDLEPHPFN